MFRMKKLRFLLFFLLITVFTGCEHPPTTIKIASFNIQIFGESVLNDPQQMTVLARIAKEFDIMAIQEIRNSDPTHMDRFVARINQDLGPKYKYVVGPRLGRSASKEQYAFIWNTATVQFQEGSDFTVEDPDDVFERKPFIAYFQSRNFDFKLVNNHIKPEDVTAELSHLAIVINNIYDGSSEKDVIVLGDMNADGSYFNENNLVVIFPLWIQLIGNDQDTTVAVSDNTYDRMMTRDTTATVEYTGTSGAFRWDKEYGVTDLSFVKKVSDHYPVYAVFRTDLPDDD